MPYVVILGQQKIQLQQQLMLSTLLGTTGLHSIWTCLCICLPLNKCSKAGLFHTKRNLTQARIKYTTRSNPGVPRADILAYVLCVASGGTLWFRWPTAWAFPDASTSKGSSPMRHRRRMVKIKHKTYLVRISKLLVMLGFKCDVTLRSKPRPPPLLGGTS